MRKLIVALVFLVSVCGHSVAQNKYGQQFLAAWVPDGVSTTVTFDLTKVPVALFYT
jgi:hypothetical protein